VAHTVAVGLSRCRKGVPCLVVYGDWVLSKDFFSNLTLDRPAVLVESSPERADEVGVVESDGFVTSFAYGLPLRWAQSVLLQDRQKILFREVVADGGERHLTHEVLARLVEGGERFRAVRAPDGSGVEVDSVGDLERAEKLARGAA
jgi:hypothetical protein